MRKTIKVCSATNASTAWCTPVFAALMFSRITSPAITCPAILPSCMDRHEQNGKRSAFLHETGCPAQENQNVTTGVAEARSHGESPTTDAESQPRALTDGLGGIERIKGAV